MTQPWHAAEVAAVLDRLSVDPDLGLSSATAESRLAESGPNQLVDRGDKAAPRILWEQVSSVMVWLLLVAAAVSLALEDVRDSAVILAIVALNVLLGFRQEYRAEKAMAALKRLAVPTVRVIRDASVREVSARSLVAGDLVLLEAGNLVPADGRVISSRSLRVQEAALTGESQDVGKTADPVHGEDPSDELPLGDRRSMVYAGTVVTYGRGSFVVTDTGMDTELGKVASMIQAVGRGQTPLQKRLDQLGRWLALVALFLVVIIFVTGLLRGEELELMFMTAVSMAVAAVPEGLPAIVTITLALGAQRMLRRNALIRALPAVETLGSVTVICSDKTGTLTANKMAVSVVVVSGKAILLDDHPTGGPAVSSHEPEVSALLDLVLAGAALCTDTVIDDRRAAGPDGLTWLGDPTEVALVVAAARHGLHKGELERSCPRVGEIPFDPVRKRMSTSHALPREAEGAAGRMVRALGSGGREERSGRDNTVTFTKGAADVLIELSSWVLTATGVEPLDAPGCDRLLAENEGLAGNGMRVLGLAYSRGEGRGAGPAVGEGPPASGLTFVGLIGMIDPARPEVKGAVATCLAAGIRPLMITGDHPATAAHIAGQLGLSTEAGVLTGAELSRMSQDELAAKVDEVSVYARVAPEHKLAVVEALRGRGHVVAMTGDGVNDAPALKRADIGVAMGVTGTDVSKEAADMVLLDDNFASIVAAVEEGRVIYDNIRKFIKYILTSNSGELAVMIVAPFLGLPLPLLPLQILWINLVTDGLPALALSLEPGERHVMRRRPRPPSESIFGRGLGAHVLVSGSLMGLVSLGAGYYYWATDNASWQTVVFTTLTLSQMGLALAVRSEREPLYRIGLFTNKALLGSVLLTFVLQLAVIYVPALQAVFETVALQPIDLLVALALSTVVFWAAEAQKVIAVGGRRRSA